MIKKATNKMKNHYRYDWKISDFLFTFIAPIICICSRDRSYGIKQRYGLFEKGETKYIKEFDAVYYARNIRNLKAIVTSMMNKKERFLVTYQKRHSISVLSDTTSSPSDKNYDHVPRLCENQKKKDDHSQKVQQFMVP
jgi:hypothetical protein